MVEAGRYIPVDKPNIISMMIFPHFLKQHTTAFKSTVILTGK